MKKIVRAETRWLRVGIGQFAVSDRPEDLIITAALGSRVAVCLSEPVAGIAGMLHFLLPDARSNPERPRRSRLPSRIPAFRCSSTPPVTSALRRNGARCGSSVDVLAARRVLWANGVMVQGEAVGGIAPRTVTLAVADGQITVKADGRVVTEL